MGHAHGRTKLSNGAVVPLKKSHLCEVSGATYIWWFDKCHTNLSQSSDKEGGSDVHTDGQSCLMERLHRSKKWKKHFYTKKNPAAGHMSLESQQIII